MATSETARLLDEKRRRIKELVCGILELNPEDITDDSLFKAEHGADSLGLLEVHAGLEQEYGISLEHLELADMTNLEALYVAVATARGPVEQ
ncbi:acyl carrier protein [Streptomyces sp. NPDC052101]|uniref:acyl carrier protein n=1 Tax=Streptomyces sp. NPDC052101 TaxID=3155763 RepID=UPI00341E4186